VPVAAEPSSAEPAAAEPATAEPTAAEPATAEPIAAEPATAEPTAAEPRKSKDDIAREKLVPLEEGERPLAVTIGAVVAALLVVGWVVSLVAGRSGVAGAAPLALLLGVAAYGMWKSRYWAVLGFQVLLAITLVNGILFLVLRADAVLDVIVGLTVVAGAGTLFWFLIRALARIQMPQRRPAG
jgi:hypothetical protein